jgi:hypothetical protein
LTYAKLSFSLSLSLSDSAQEAVSNRGHAPLLAQVLAEFEETALLSTANGMPLFAKLAEAIRSEETNADNLVELFVEFSKSKRCFTSDLLAELFFIPNFSAFAKQTGFVTLLRALFATLYGTQEGFDASNARVLDSSLNSALSLELVQLMLDSAAIVFFERTTHDHAERSLLLQLISAMLVHLASNGVVVRVGEHLPWQLQAFAGSPLTQLANPQGISIEAVAQLVDLVVWANAPAERIVELVEKLNVNEKAKNQLQLGLALALATTTSFQFPRCISLLELLVQHIPVLRGNSVQVSVVQLLLALLQLLDDSHLCAKLVQKGYLPLRYSSSTFARLTARFVSRFVSSATSDEKIDVILALMKSMPLLDAAREQVLILFLDVASNDAVDELRGCVDPKQLASLAAELARVFPHHEQLLTVLSSFAQ